MADRARQPVRVAEALLQQGYVRECEALLKVLASSSAYAEEAHYALGLIRLRLNDHQAAERRFRKVLGVNNRNAAAMFRLAGILTYRHDWRGAWAAYSQILALAPGHAESVDRLRKLPFHAAVYLMSKVQSRVMPLALAFVSRGARASLLATSVSLVLLFAALGVRWPSSFYDTLGVPRLATSGGFAFWALAAFAVMATAQAFRSCELPSLVSQFARLASRSEKRVLGRLEQEFGFSAITHVRVRRTTLDRMVGQGSVVITGVVDRHTLLPRRAHHRKHELELLGVVSGRHLEELASDLQSLSQLVQQDQQGHLAAQISEFPAWARSPSILPPRSRRLRRRLARIQTRGLRLRTMSRLRRDQSARLSR